MDAPAVLAKLPLNHRLVYDVVQSSGVGRHISMDDVYAMVRARKPGIGFTTVYRALARLRDAGLVSEIHLPGATRAVFEPASPPHAHFHCTLCGRIEDVDLNLSDELAAKLAGASGRRIRSVHLSLDGTCASCASTTAPA